MKKDKKLIIIRGVSGSGKSNLGSFLESSISGHLHLENDMWVWCKGEYLWSKDRARYAADRCFSEVSNAMESGVSSISVGNTFVKEKYVKRYEELAKMFGYTVTSMVLENRIGTMNNKGNDKSVLDRMRQGLKSNIKL